MRILETQENGDNCPSECDFDVAHWWLCDCSVTYSVTARAISCNQGHTIITLHVKRYAVVKLHSAANSTVEMQKDSPEKWAPRERNEFWLARLRWNKEKKYSWQILIVYYYWSEAQKVKQAFVETTHESISSYWNLCQSNQDWGQIERCRAFLRRTIHMMDLREAMGFTISMPEFTQV